MQKMSLLIYTNPQIMGLPSNQKFQLVLHNEDELFTTNFQLNKVGVSTIKYPREELFSGINFSCY
jgi:hypothetical protein